MAKRKYTTPPKEKVEKLRSLGPSTCHVCNKERPVGPLPYGWGVHVVDDERYAKGYWMPLSCSRKCREEGGLKNHV